MAIVQAERHRADQSQSRLRLQTAVRLRWFGVVGQLVTVCVVYLGFGFQLPFGICLAFIALSAWLNVFLRILYPARTRLSSGLATSLLAYDILQLAALLYLTGGIQNPFTFLLVAPVTVSAATLPPHNTVALGLIGAAATVLLVFYHLPLPWQTGAGLQLPMVYNVGLLASVLSGMIFLALYAWRLAKESRQMADALAATEMVLAREQQLHALDGLAAAAAHELGTPLSTIAVIAKELTKDAPPGSQLAEDLALLQTQAVRCREILRKLTRSPTEPDPLHARMSITQLIEEAAGPYRGFGTELVVSAAPEGGSGGAAVPEPIGERRPGVLYGLGNLVENAVDFASQRVEITASWSARQVMIEIADDGPGFPVDVMDALGEPYVTTRPAKSRSQIKDGGPSGLGLGYFIAKTLLERSGATVTLDNRPRPKHGAVVRVSWPREAFERKGATAALPDWRGAPRRLDADRSIH
ncbi:MAG TPA: ActS/PrrB/RegB family redox-sensitive histidine kinase [Hyphomicrobiaceae bacterium]|nr:ActS/PrrB/RegB family redox-sensitive histidine kinase [Hyphomicrobiaceae bacterium]